MSPGPRILFVNHASRVAGAELVLLDVVRGFAGAGAFLFEDGPLRPALAAAGVLPIVAGEGGFAAIKRDRSLWRALPHLGGLARTLLRLRKAARRYDLIYANSQKAFVLAALAAMAARRTLVWHLHDILSAGHFGSGQIRLAVFLANRCAARVIVPSQAAAAAFVAAGGRQALLRVVPNGLDAPASDDRSLRCSFGLSTPFIFGVFSRISPWKGQGVALEALASLPGVGCVIVGSALFGEEDYAESLKARAASLGIADRVRFLGQRADVAALMRAVDAVVHPSVEPEPFGRTLVEAMLARRPVVAAEAGAVPEILECGRLGVLFPPGDAAALAARLRAVQDGAAASMIGPAERRARDCYSATRMRDAIRTVVEQAASA